MPSLKELLFGCVLQLMKAMMKEMNEIAKGNLSKEDMERGR